MKSYVTASAPATVANVGPGFDVLGFALDGPRVEVSIRKLDTADVIVRTEGAELPSDPAKNTAAVAAVAVRDACGATCGLEIIVRAGIPICSGLGSSAGSAVAGAVAANALFGGMLQPQRVVDCALSGEAAASGARHADNVAPAFFGGFGIVRTHDPIDWIPVRLAAPWHCVVVHPNVVVRTADARRVLPATIPLSTACTQWAQVASLIAAFTSGDESVLTRALHDPLIEPLRGALIPGYAAVKTAALSAGAIGCTVSGSGPSMCAFVRDSQSAETVGAAMIAAFAAVGVTSQRWISAIGAAGAEVIRS